MTPNRHGSAVVTYPNDLEIVITREFEAPIALVFDVLTKPEHVSKWFAPFTCEVTKCSIDLHVGGSYHIVFVAEDGTECSFRGTYLEVEPPTRTVATWLFEGWPDAHAVESTDLRETDGVTTLTNKMAFRDKAGRDHMNTSDGTEDSFDKLEDHLRSLLGPKADGAEERQGSLPAALVLRHAEDERHHDCQQDSDRAHEQPDRDNPEDQMTRWPGLTRGPRLQAG